MARFSFFSDFSSIVNIWGMALKVRYSKIWQGFLQQINFKKKVSKLRSIAKLRAFDGTVLFDKDYHGKKFVLIIHIANKAL
jgi:hypothetical protein